MSAAFNMSRIYVRALAVVFVSLLVVEDARAGSIHPYYRRRPPVHDKTEKDFNSTCAIDLSAVMLPSFPDNPGDLAAYNRLFDARAAAIVHRSALGRPDCKPVPEFQELISHKDLLDHVDYEDAAPAVDLMRGKALAAMAYADFFPQTKRQLRGLVNRAIYDAGPGWSGTIGPGQDNFNDLVIGKKREGNYDMTQMYLIPLAYRYYDELTPESREKLVRVLLAQGRVHRINRPESLTSGRTPDDWARAGVITPLAVTHKSIGETENHIMMILTARYLTNQLLYPRDPDVRHDNRRNGSDPHSNTTDVILSLLRNILRGDFSEYNAKNYQTETRFALLNLATYAYDKEVRLGARMVLDYISARYAVTSNDLRRMLPFRRRNEHPKVSILGKWGVPDCPNVPVPQGCSPDPGPAPYDGIMDVGLLDWVLGADPLTMNFALQAGNTRALEEPFIRCSPPHKDHGCQRYPVRGIPKSIAHDGGEPSIEALTDYRLPPSIHDLIVNDPKRRFYQKLHRISRPEETGGNRNCDNWEINAGSSSYLITAGGSPCDYAVNPRFAGILFTDETQQKGVAVTTSFMPTGKSADVQIHDASNLIQFSNFSDDREGVANYGVGPDIAFGHAMYLPKWVTDQTGPLPERGFVFVNKNKGPKLPGFYLAIFHDHGFGLLEAFDTWRNDKVTFDQFKTAVLNSNRDFKLENNVETEYVTQANHRVRLVIWNNGERLDVENGAQVLGIRYGQREPNDQIGDAGNDTSKFLNGTILNNPREAVVEIHNPHLGTTIVLDMNDRWNPKRTAEDGTVEYGGSNNEVWVDFDWVHQSEGDFYRPFKTLSAAVDGVARGGTLKIMPGSIREPIVIRKPMRLVAPIGGVVIGRD